MRLKRMMLLLIFGIILVSGTTVYAATTNNVINKVQTRLESANRDIFSTFQLNNVYDDYQQFVMPDSSNKNNTLNEIAQEFDNLDQSPIGSTKPLYLISKDSTKLMVVYKEKDGTNVMRYAKKVANEWQEGEKTTKGAPILGMDEIKD